MSIWFIERNRKRTFWRPVVEVLEGRRLPATVTVANTADSGDGSLRTAIMQADPGDTIVFDPNLAGQTITLTSSPLTVNKDLTIHGLGADQLAVSGNDQRTVFSTNAPDLLVISGLTITHGRSNGIFNSGSLELDDDVITENTAGTGGGIFNTGYGTMTLNDCVVSFNTAASAGGIQNQGISMTLNNCQVVNNTARGPVGGFGGGIASLLREVVMNINNSVIANNSAERDGGGIYSQSMLTLTDSTVSENTAQHNGGGIINGDLGTLTVVQSTIDDNTADVGGGGVYSTDMVMISDSTIANNTATSTDMPTASAVTGGGGVIATAGARVTIANSTIANNSTGWDGGGVEYLQPAFGSYLSLFDTIVADNSAMDGGPDAAGALTSQGHNLIGIGDGASGLDPSDLVGSSDQPLDPMLGPLQDNGGPTQTMALLPGSPAVDAGDNGNAPDFDQRGPGFDRIVGGTIDIGAYEAQIGQTTAFAIAAPDTVVAGTPFDVTVTALDAYGHIATGYTGTVTFATTDPDMAVILPEDYTFSPDDAGVHTFTDTGRGETALVTPGEQMLTVTDTADNNVTGSAAIDVVSADAGVGVVADSGIPQRLQGSIA
jgi:predicted outer membrane repeat protein